MIWKVIGKSVIGSSHVLTGKTCEDALHYQIIKKGNDEILTCFISDGAGSAKYAARASEIAVQQGVGMVEQMVRANVKITEQNLLAIAASIYDKLKAAADELQVPLNEFSCTLLGFVILPWKACFLQIGDGAIIRGDDQGYFTHLWWPQNGEYQNTTTFLIDNPSLPNLKVKIIEEGISEVAIFTDGLQMLTLDNQSVSVHQPFFTGLFQVLRKATGEEHISILNNKLVDYLSGDAINNRTDDDKTLLLATKINNGSPGI